MDLEVDVRFGQLLAELEKTAGGGLDLQAVVFMIGLQELNFGFRMFTKDEKLQVMHVATCALLEPYGYYRTEGRDEDGWIHFSVQKKLPPLSDKEQQQFMKRAILEYFDY
jgi:hypothetical protein